MSSSDSKKSKTGVELVQSQTEVILQSLSEGVCQISVEGKVGYVNRSAELFLNRDASEILGRYYSELFFAEDDRNYLKEVPFCPIRFVLATGENVHVNTEVFIQKGGKELQVEYVCAPLFENEEVSGAVISFENIAERYEAEKAVEKGRDMAIEAAQAKAAFLANMSHEIRTPLNGIVGTTNLLSDSKLSEEQENYVQMLKTSTELLRAVVNDILDFSKIESGLFQLEVLEFGIHKLLKETATFFRPLANEKQLELNLKVDPDVAAILKGDSGKIKQVLNNFVSNAIKFTSEGSVKIALSLVSEDELSQHLRFEVADTGIGIKQDAQSLLFQPFVQADASTTRVYGGTGLGLAISRQIAEMMGGNVGLESTFGEGTTFWFTVQLEKFLDAEGSLGLISKIEENDDKGNTETVIFPKDIKVLIVEDNPINRVVTSKMLEQFGLFPDTAENGVLAIEKMENKAFDLVFMDCQMPELDGFEAAEKIRKLQISQPKIVALTASTSITERERCIESGMDDYLSKPFTKKELSNVLQNYFEPKILDLSDNIVQHSLENIIGAKKLEKFLEIESNGKDRFTSEILNLYLEHSEKLIAELNKAFSLGDFTRIAELAHNLKGSSGNAGVFKLFNLFEELEKEIEQENPVAEFISKINREFRHTKEIILSTK